MSRFSRATLAQVLSTPGTFAKAFVGYLRANGAKVTIEKTIAEVTYYWQQNIAANLVSTFFNGVVTATNTNLVSAVRPESEHAIIEGIRILDADAAVAINLQDWNPGANLPVVKNAYLDISINGQNVVKRLPLTRATPGLTTEDDGFIWLDEPLVWPGQTELVATVTFGTAPGANNALRIELVGVGMIS